MILSCLIEKLSEIEVVCEIVHVLNFHVRCFLL